jgi:hypothetical protein
MVAPVFQRWCEHESAIGGMAAQTPLGERRQAIRVKDDPLKPAASNLTNNDARLALTRGNDRQSGRSASDGHTTTQPVCAHVEARA